MKTLAMLILASTALAAQASSGLRPDPPKNCSSCPGWNRARPPFQVFGNTYYVGVDGLSSLLITSDDGLILLDGALPESAPLIDANIRTLGFRPENIRLILASHEHYDHVGGIAALQRLSGATVAAGPAAATALRQGLPGADDPQIAFGREANAFPPVQNVRGVADGEVLRVGSLAVTAHLTPGHTPGSTTWSWRSCEGSRCLDLVYADSLNAVSSGGFRFTGSPNVPSRIPAFRSSIAKISALPCDIVIAVHPGFTNIDDKLKRRAANATVNAFVDPQGCRTYAADAGRRLDARIASEAGPTR